jgi:hypothetical protein
MPTLSLVLEDRDEYGDLTEYHKHEVQQPGQVLSFCRYFLFFGDEDTARDAISRLFSMCKPGPIRRLTSMGRSIDIEKLAALIEHVETHPDPDVRRVFDMLLMDFGFYLEEDGERPSQQLYLVIEARDDREEIVAQHRHEVTDPRAIVEFCHYVVRGVDDNGMAGAAGALLKLHSEAYEEYKRVWDEWIRIEEASEKQVIHQTDGNS